jgi:hypothetical protein
MFHNDHYKVYNFPDTVLDQAFLDWIHSRYGMSSTCSTLQVLRNLKPTELGQLYLVYQGKATEELPVITESFKNAKKYDCNYHQLFHKQ